MQSQRTVIDGTKAITGRNLVPVPLFPPQISHGRIWGQTRASAMTGR